MSEPFFPPPTKKESAPYRAAAEVPLLDAAPPGPRRPARPVAPRVEPKPPPRPLAEAGPAEEPFLVRLGWRLAKTLVALAATTGILWGLVRAHELGEKWPQAVLVVLGVAGILAAPVVLYFRLRRIIRFLFARDDDA